MEPLFITGNEQLQYLEPFVKLLIQKFQPEQIVCFASNLITEERDSCFTNKILDCKHHCSLLLVANDAAKIHYAVQDFSNSHYKIGRVTTICHEPAVINEAIETNSRFFISVYTKGWLLYGKELLTGHDFNVSYNPALATEKATKHLNHRIPLAEGFLAGAYECFIKKQYLVSTFMLHQVVEQCCILLIRVHMGYRSEFHNLYRLLGLCNSFSNQPYSLFFSGSKEDLRLFDLLIKSYSKSRYSSQFKVVEQDNLLLYERVLDLLNLTKEMCENEITALAQQAKIYTQLNHIVTSNLN